MKERPVKFSESYALDENDKPATTINEGVHCSVPARDSGSAQICSDNAKGVCSLGPYKPENVAPLFNGGTFAGLPIVD